MRGVLRSKAAVTPPPNRALNGVRREIGDAGARVIVVGIDTPSGERMSDRTDDSGDGFGEVVDRLSNVVEESEQNRGGEIPETDGEMGVVDARDVGRAVAEDLTGLPLDGIVEVDNHEDGWRVIAEVVKRHSIPDTQDILDRYVISLDATGSVRGYGRAGRYRRGNVGEQREIFAATDAERGMT